MWHLWGVCVHISPSGLCYMFPLLKHSRTIWCLFLPLTLWVPFLMSFHLGVFSEPPGLCCVSLKSSFRVSTLVSTLLLFITLCCNFFCSLLGVYRSKLCEDIIQVFLYSLLKPQQLSLSNIFIGLKKTICCLMNVGWVKWMECIYAGVVFCVNGATN